MKQDDESRSREIPFDETLEQTRWLVFEVLRDFEATDSLGEASVTVLHTLDKHWELGENHLMCALYRAQETIRSALTIPEIIGLHADDLELRAAFENEAEKEFYYSVNTSAIEATKYSIPTSEVIRWFVIYCFYRTAKGTSTNTVVQNLRNNCTFDGDISVSEMRSVYYFWLTVVMMGSLAASGYVYPPMREFLDQIPPCELDGPEETD